MNPAKSPATLTLLSVVAHEAARAPQDFLTAGFDPSNPPLAHVLGGFLAEHENLAIALPPKLAPEGDSRSRKCRSASRDAPSAHRAPAS